MLCLDTNVLVNAFRVGSPVHSSVRSWLTDALDGEEQVILPVDVGAAFLRLSTNTRLFPDASSTDDAMEFLKEIVGAARIVSASPWAWEHFQWLVTEMRLMGNDIPDALIAAQAIDHDAAIATFDRGFARFPRLRVLDLSVLGSSPDA